MTAVRTKRGKESSTNLKLIITQSWTKHKPGSSALGCVVYLVVFLKRKRKYTFRDNSISSFLVTGFVRGEVLEICGWLILIMTLVMFMVLDSEGTKVFLKVIVSE